MILLGMEHLIARDPMIEAICFQRLFIRTSRTAYI